MQHYSLLESFDDEVGTVFTKFDIQPTEREMRSISSLAGTVSALFIYCDTVVDAGALTVRLTADSLGDVCLLTDTQVGMTNGITTITKTSSVIKIEIDMHDSFPNHCWIKTDIGTANVRNVRLTWRV